MATVRSFAYLQLPYPFRSASYTAGLVLCARHQRLWTCSVTQGLRRACYSTSKAPGHESQKRQMMQNQRAAKTKELRPKSKETVSKQSRQGSGKTKQPSVVGRRDEGKSKLGNSSGAAPLQFLVGGNYVSLEVLHKWALNRAQSKGTLPETGLQMPKWSVFGGNEDMHWWNIQEHTAEDSSLRQKELRKVGFSEEEVKLLIQLIPQWPNVDLLCVHAVYRALQNKGMSEEWIHSVLKNSFSLFLQSAVQVDKRFEMLEHLGLKKEELSTLLLHFPSLLFCRLTRPMVYRIMAARDIGFGAHWSRKDSNQQLSPDAEEVSYILKGYNLDPTFVLTRDPQFFNQSAKRLISIVRMLTQKPLYLGTRDLQSLFSIVPRQLRKIANEATLCAHVNALCKLFMSNRTVHYALHKYPFIVSPSCDVEGKGIVLEQVGFSAKERTTLFFAAPPILLQDTRREFEPRIRALTSDVNPSAIVESPLLARLLTTPLDVVEARISYARQLKPSLLDGSKLEEIVCSTDKTFAELCNIPVDHYYRDSGQQRMVLNVSIGGWGVKNKSASKQDTTLRRDQVHLEKMAPKSEPVCELEEEGMEVNRDHALVTEALVTEVSTPDVMCNETADNMKQSAAKLVATSKTKLGRSNKKVLNTATKTVFKKASKTTIKKERTGIKATENAVLVSKKSGTAKKKIASKGDTKAIDLEERDDECLDDLTDFEEISQVLGPLPV